MTDINTKPKGIVAYYRVSTDKQGASGLGLEAQRSTVERYAAGIGATIFAAFTEVESGKIAARPELEKAIALCRRSGYTLAIAKLDRLARNVAFLTKLMDLHGLEFVACDLPHANRLTIHILAAVAEDEARRISERTKAGLAALKARGVLLGSARPGHWDGREHLRQAGLLKGQAIAHRVAHQRWVELVGPIWREYRELRDAGVAEEVIAQRLNDRGERTATGLPWSKQALKNLQRSVDRHSGLYKLTRRERRKLRAEAAARSAALIPPVVDSTLVASST